jgi:hypothetical protein
MSPRYGEAGYKRRRNDAYFSEEWLGRVLLEHGRLRGTIWEPFAGRGYLVRVWRAAGHTVIASDRRKWGFPLDDQLDFRKAAKSYGHTIASNPPFENVDEILPMALQLTRGRRGMVAFLLLNEWDTAQCREELTEFPFARKIVLRRRPRWIPNSKGHPRNNFAWYIWDWQRPREADPTIHYAL